MSNIQIKNSKYILILSILLMSFIEISGQKIVTLDNKRSYEIDDTLHVITRIEPMRKSHIDHVGTVFDFDWKVFASKMDDAIDEWKLEGLQSPEGTIIVITLSYSIDGEVEGTRYFIVNKSVEEISIDDIDRLDAVLREIKINVRTDYPNGALYQICKRIKI